MDCQNCKTMEARIRSLEMQLTETQRIVKILTDQLNYYLPKESRTPQQYDYCEVNTPICGRSTNRDPFYPTDTVITDRNPIVVKTTPIPTTTTRRPRPTMPPRYPKYTRKAKQIESNSESDDNNDAAEETPTKKQRRDSNGQANGNSGENVAKKETPKVVEVEEATNRHATDDPIEEIPAEAAVEEATNGNTEAATEDKKATDGSGNAHALEKPKCVRCPCCQRLRNRRGLTRHLAFCEKNKALCTVQPNARCRKIHYISHKFVKNHD